MKPRQNKVIYQGITFRSNDELRYYREVLEPYIGKTILSVEYERPFVLVPDYERLGKPERKMVYSPDFFITYENGEQLAVEIKGFMRDDARDRIKFFKWRYQDIPFNVVGYCKALGGWVPYSEIEKYRRKKKKENGDGKTIRVTGHNVKQRRTTVPDILPKL